jgi:hypothetical protein
MPESHLRDQLLLSGKKLEKILTKQHDKKARITIHKTKTTSSLSISDLAKNSLTQ